MLGMQNTAEGDGFMALSSYGAKRRSTGNADPPNWIGERSTGLRVITATAYFAGRPK
jgi:hypothetical protein